MLTDEDVLVIGFSLENKGMSHEEIDAYLAHYGVQGMKWGVRRSMNKSSVAKLRGKGLTGTQAKATVRYQNRIDAQKMAAVGRKGKVNVLRQLSNRSISNMQLGLGTIARHPLSTKKAAGLQLERNKELQKKISGGKAKVRNYLFELRGISMKNVDFSLSAKDAKAVAAYRQSGPIKNLVRDSIGAQPKTTTKTRKPRTAIAIPL